ncbi:unnamed protein product [Anisakis simplex]|uniref:GatB_Yqey domain-containing protein n=1 Tax=Anisakis simplex TaxID=6269 RepID=A0A0M3JDB4_ANISI|nr:unnamed protein product [Anisakis simplex]
MATTLFPNVARRIEILTEHKISNDLETRYIVDAIQKVIKERRSNPNVIQHDFLQLLLDCSEKKTDDGEVDLAITNDVISKGGHKVIEKQLTT